MNPFFADARTRLVARVVVDADGCWLFSGSHSGFGRGGGYGRLLARLLKFHGANPPDAEAAGAVARLRADFRRAPA